ncbi:MAG: hypothetical protein OXE41_04910 [Gammaproteobacteria bacterium]|nr:hypothetical protein [Gammaproteobacteria bacterium]
MNQAPFTQPLPAEPLLMNQWLDRTDRAEVGREPFFAVAFWNMRFFVTLFQD